MDDLLSEKEQIEQLRSWWSDYGNYVLAGVVLGALALFGYNYYQSSRLESAYAASGSYDELADAVADGKVDEAETLSARIVSEYPESAYAAQARLAMARLYMDQSRDQDAADALKELVGSSADDKYRQVARLRLARILLYQEKADEVLTLLGEPGAGDGAFAARYDEVRGDAHVALGDLDAAREAYRSALSEAGRDTTINQEFVQLKLLDLPIEEVPAANQPATDLPPVDAGDAPAEPDAPPAPESAESVEPDDSTESAKPVEENGE